VLLRNEINKMLAFYAINSKVKTRNHEIICVYIIIKKESTITNGDNVQFISHYNNIITHENLHILKANLHALFMNKDWLTTVAAK
jgi:hypothetical protein